MITEKLCEIYGWKTGTLINEGFLVKCSGTPDDSTTKHLIATLDDHLPETMAHAVGNSEFTDDLWIIDSAQSEIDWTNPVCQICSKPIAP